MEQCKSIYFNYFHLLKGKSFACIAIFAWSRYFWENETGSPSISRNQQKWKVFLLINAMSNHLNFQFFVSNVQKLRPV